MRSTLKNTVKHHSLEEFRLWRNVMLLFCLALVVLSSACSTKTVKSTTFTPMDAPPEPFQEHQLLDVGISVLDPGLDDLSEKEAELTFADVRRAETYYTAHLMAQTLQLSGHWGVVRVIPNDLSATDVSVRGALLQSDGETMRVNVAVSDSTGREWFEKEYEEVVSKFSYDPRRRSREDAFQGLYNQIANDMLNWRLENLTDQNVADIHTVSELQFARSFAPNAFDQYLSEDRRGRLQINRLPAANDPVLLRVQDIRERDYLFVDTLQEYYSGFARQMEEPYTEYRKSSYDEVVKMEQLQRDARRNLLLGGLAILGGLAATQSDAAGADLVVLGGLLAGGFLIKDGIYTNDEAKMYVESLAELGDSLETELTPKTIELEERTITLTGNVESQYNQWREILADLYAAEIGELEAAASN